MPTYEVICGNIGTVYSGSDRDTADRTFAVYADHSEQDYGRAAGESVVLFEDNEIIREHLGTVKE